MTATEAAPEAAEHGQPYVDESGRLPLSHWAAITWVLAARTFRLRYLRSRLGIGWALAQPLIQAAVLSVVFMKLVKIGRVEHYPLYVLAGVMTWQCFSGAVASATTSPVDNAALLRKVDMPALVFPLSQVLAVAMVFVMQLVILVGFAVAVGTGGLSLLLLPLGVALTALVATGVGCLTGAFQVEFRDVKFLVDSGLMMAFYATPVIFDPARFSDHTRFWLSLNPMYGVLSLVRHALLERPLDVRSLWLGAFGSLLLLVVGVTAFRRRSIDFADLA